MKLSLLFGFCLFVACELALAAISAPGWIIYVAGGVVLNNVIWYFILQTILKSHNHALKAVTSVAKTSIYSHERTARTVIQADVIRTTERGLAAALRAGASWANNGELLLPNGKQAPVEIIDN